jgi:cytochrome P450
MQITEAFLQDPYPTYARMREAAAAHWSDANGGTWFIPRYADVCAGFLDVRLSSGRKADAAADQFPKEARPEFEPSLRVMREWLVLLDPPKHTQLRKLMNKGFVKDVMDNLRPRVQQVTDQLLERAAAEGRVNFVEALARPLPAQIICDLLGVEHDVQADFIRWSEDIVSFGGSLKPSVELFRAAQHAVLSMLDYFAKLVPERKRRMGDDMVSLLLRAEEADVVTSEQVLANCIQLIFAGNETTRNLIANGMHVLLTRPEAMQNLRDHPELLPNAALEMLRFESPLQLIRRVVDVDMHWCGVHMRAGQGLILMTGSANRDSAAFPDPDKFDLRRGAPKHVAYGHGIHRCIGAVLATMETEIALGSVLRRFRRIEPDAAAPGRLTNPMLRGFSELPVQLR